MPRTNDGTKWLPWWPNGKEYACRAGDVGSIPGQEDPLEREMAAHSSILAWEILWTVDPGGLQSVGVRMSWTQLID